MAKDREYDEKMARKKASTPFGQESSAAARALGTAFGQTSKSTKPKPKSVKPKNVDRSIKVSQSEINQIKKLGMKKALEIAAGNRGSTYSGAVASFGEGVRRLYGDARYQNAVFTPKASPGPVSQKSNYQTGSSVSRVNSKPKSKNVAGFKPGSVGAKFISAIRNTGK